MEHTVVQSIELPKLLCFKHRKTCWYHFPFEADNVQHQLSKANGYSELLCESCLSGSKQTNDGTSQ